MESSRVKKALKSNLTPSNLLTVTESHELNSRAAEKEIKMPILNKIVAFPSTSRTIIMARSTINLHFPRHP